MPALMRFDTRSLAGRMGRMDGHDGATNLDAVEGAVIWRLLLSQ